MRKYLMLLVGMVGVILVAHLGLPPHAMAAAAHLGAHPMTGTPYEP